MKQHMTGIWIALALSLSACSSIRFDTPMPVATAPLAEFPAGIFGRYYLADSSFIDRKDTFYNTRYYEQALPAKDSILMFSVELAIQKKIACLTIKILMFCKSCPEEIPDKGKGYGGLKQMNTKVYKRDGYTVYESMSMDTIVNLKKKDKLKYDGKAYYLNHFLSDKKNWEIYRLKVQGKNDVSVSMTNAKDKKYLERFIVKKGILVPTVHLTDEQFQQFLKQGGFHLKLRFRK